MEDIGKYGYFELKPDVVQGIGVKITTASTNTILPILERQKITEFMNNITTLMNMAALDQTGEMMAKVKEFVRPDELMAWMSDAYGYDSNSLKANSGKDKIKKENLDKIKQIKDFITNNTPNAPQTTQLPTAVPTAPQTNPTAQGGNPTSQI